MNRRRLLALTAGVPTAGCLGVTGVPRSGGDAVRPCGPSGVDPDPREVCPRDDYGGIVWAADAGPDAPVRMVASRSSARLPVSGLEFTLKNESGQSAVFNPYNWGLWRWTGDRWTSATTGPIKLPARGLSGDRSYTWSLTATGADRDGETPERDGGRRAIHLEGLQGGTYAFGAAVDFEEGVPVDGTDHSVETVAGVAVVELWRRT